MIRETIQVLNQTGIHARPATKLVKVATAYKSDISIVKNGKTVNAKSILGVMGLAMSYNENIELIVDGEDEQQALEKIKRLFEEKFGEE